MKLTLHRIIYILYRIASDLISLFSRALNAFAFGGSTAQTTSARAHLEAPTSPEWARRRRFINAIFWLQDDHCKRAWEYEVERARYVLSLLKDGGHQ